MWCTDIPRFWNLQATQQIRRALWHSLTCSRPILEHSPAPWHTQTSLWHMKPSSTGCPDSVPGADSCPGEMTEARPVSDRTSWTSLHAYGHFIAGPAPWHDLTSSHFIVSHKFSIHQTPTWCWQEGPIQTLVLVHSQDKASTRARPPAAPQNDRQIVFNRIINCVCDSSTGILHSTVRLPEQTETLPICLWACQSHPEPCSLILLRLAEYVLGLASKSKFQLTKKELSAATITDPPHGKTLTATDIHSI